MRAIVRYRYCGPDGLELREVPPPSVKDDEVLVRVRAASVNTLDWHFMTGTPYMVRTATGLRRPRNAVLGADFAGSVESVGAEVTAWQAGDHVFGMHNGAFADYVSVPSEKLARKPATVTFEQVAAVPIAGLTALQGLRDKGRIEPGQRVLINGASGAVGTFALQIARHYDASVTAVCSTANVETARKLGADRVIDYRKEDPDDSRYDLILDIVGNRGLAEWRRVLSPGGTLVFVGGPKTNRWFGPLAGQALMRLRDRRIVMYIATVRHDDLSALASMLAEGAIVPEIERSFSLAGVPEALTYLSKGHARGKLVVSL